MFERFTQMARRVIFFARYEASQYGSPYIETEHLLLGLLREDKTLVRTLWGQGDADTEIRSEIERRITKRERISTSVEVPLTADCKKILNLAAQEADRLAHRYIGTEHLLLGILRVERSLAGQLLQARGVETNAVREQVAKTSGSPRISVVSSRERRDEKAKLTLESFLAGLTCSKSEELIEFFANKSQFIDATGRRWNRDETFKSFETLFAPYAKKNAAPVIEELHATMDDLFVAHVLWKNAILASQQRIWVHRMSVVLIREGEDWRILLIHVTPVQLP